jgi:hypothetical protein
MVFREHSRPEAGPFVLVRRSYGGAVITNAAVGNPNVKAFACVAGFAPDIGADTLHLTGEDSFVPPRVLRTVLDSGPSPRLSPHASTPLVPTALAR